MSTCLAKSTSSSTAAVPADLVIMGSLTMWATATAALHWNWWIAACPRAGSPGIACLGARLQRLDDQGLNLGARHAHRAAEPCLGQGALRLELANHAGRDVQPRRGLAHLQ